MDRYVIFWDAGYGQMTDVVEADNIEQAEDIAYQCWRDAAESQAEYGAIAATEESLEDYGLSE